MSAHFSLNKAVTSARHVEEDLETIMVKVSGASSSAGVASQDDNIVKPSQLLAAELATSQQTVLSTICGDARDIIPEAISSPPLSRSSFFLPCFSDMKRA
jgi:hypothetical protein